MQSLIAALEEEESDLKLRRGRLINSTLHIHRLPDEILSQIIIYLVAPALSISNTFSCTSYNVCHRWRQCALRTVQIWSYLSVSPSSDYEAMRVCLERSRTSPLYLSLSLTPCRRSMASQMIHVIKTTLIPHYARCRGLQISIYDTLLVKHVFPLHRDFNSLHQFTLKWYGAEGKPVVLDPNVPNHLPALKQLEVYALDVEDGLFPLQTLQCSNITHLDLWKAVPCQVVWDTLPQFTSLRVFEWEYSAGAAFAPARRPASPVVIPQLETLRLRTHDWQSFFELTRTPKLKHLAVQGGIRLMPDRSTGLGIALNSGNLDGVEVLDVETCFVNYETMSTMFRTLKYLKHFRYNWWSNETCLALETLVFPDPQSNPSSLYCPQLQTITMLVGTSSPRGRVCSRVFRRILRWRVRWMLWWGRGRRVRERRG